MWRRSRCKKLQWECIAMKYWSIQIFILLFLFNSGSSRANEAAKNNFYFELGGNGIFYSINYDRLLLNSFSSRIGFMHIEFEFGPNFGNRRDQVTAIPIILNYLYGSGKNKIEIGTGIVIYCQDNNWKEAGVQPALTLGYRYQPQPKGLIFRIGYTPIISKEEILSWAGISIGFGL